MRNISTVFFFILCSVSLLISKTIKVPQDYSKIQSAINAAVNGDTVLVDEGTYFENLLLKKKIILGSLFILDGDTMHISNTIIDGGTPSHVDSGSVILVTTGSDTSTIIAGFTIQNGTSSKNVAASDGSLWSAGGGIFCNRGGATIVRNIIVNNLCEGANSSGGGIATWEATPIVIIRSNIIRRNTAKSPDNAECGGVSIGTNAEISNNIISHNHVENGAFGGMAIWGVGMTVTVINNTITMNSSYGGAEGFGVYYSTVYLMNNIIWNTGDGAELNGHRENVLATNNLVRGSFYGENNFSQPPAFSDSIKLFLSPESPAISAGRTSATYGAVSKTAPALDIYGTPRPQPDNSSPDLGAVESPVSVAVPFSQPPQMLNRTMYSELRTRKYLVFLPKNYSTTSKLPVLLFFHGDGGSSTTYLGLGLNDIADQKGIIVVYPDSYVKYSPSWNSSSSTSYDMIFVNQLLDTLIRNYKVDSTRIFLSGHSQGGLMTFAYTGYYGTRIRAIAIMGQTLPKSITSIPREVPMIYFMGTIDGNVSYYGSSTRYSAEATASVWAGFNNCFTPSPVVENLPDVVPSDKCTAVKITYPKPGTKTPPVQLYKIVGGAHSIPGPQFWIHPPVNRDINAPELIFNFIDSVTITGAPLASAAIPEMFILSQNYPNPFNPSTTIRYSLPSSAHVKLVIYNVLGQEVSELVNEEQSAGWKEVQWNAAGAASGMYLVRMQAGLFSETKKILLMR